MTLQVVVPAACLRSLARRTGFAASRALTGGLLALALGSCTGTVQAPPDSPQPQTPHPSSSSSQPRGLNLPPAGTPTVHVSQYPLDQDVGPQTCAPGHC